MKFSEDELVVLRNHNDYPSHTCFSSWEEAAADTTNVMVNAPRALIAVDIVGVAKGILLENVRLAMKSINEKKCDV